MSCTSGRSAQASASKPAPAALADVSLERYSRVALLMLPVLFQHALHLGRQHTTVEVPADQHRRRDGAVPGA